MNRKKFLQTSLKALGAFTIVPFLAFWKKEKSISGDCVVTPSETAGPFPTKKPGSLQMMDIRADRAGAPMEITLTIQNRNDNCAPLPEAIVDIWHCDKDGYYSEYGSHRLQQEDFTAAHFLRGRQLADKAGRVGFTSIFPGWYRGRAPHIHVHIYAPNGRSLLVTQIAFPTDICDTVYTSATGLYTRGKQDTPNLRDNIFRDSLERELARVTGSLAEGYRLEHVIVVEG